MYRAKETFWAPGNRHVVKGDLVAAHDAVIKGREDLFEAVVIPQALPPAEADAAQQESEPAATDSRPADETPEASGPGQEPTQAPTADGADDGGSPPAAAAAKKTAAKKTTAPRKPAGGDAK
ncbi:hypothetical protein PYK79_41645 [Streptomyces sp. ID05-04B]|uniref:hypothetical protein n=1 Tax=unclassified Streptomyces TaxID=2593676 RepID=UPI000D1BA903|nr:MULTISPECIES: hypothetical protein [unclassified Streptomyces]AVV46460.1 hypothetical protein C6376_38985 [Streptomyces sp. P3]AVV46520.1 hypothetical protein C6376_39290 [Streptomyces sp. P3]MDX5568508.1 hypothetical protein [Streptomyces sp. ID05-04B]